MSQHHCHQHCCEHTNVKLCKVCGNVYCVECGKEWYKNQYNYQYPFYQTTTKWQEKFLTDAIYMSKTTDNTLCSHKEG